MFALISFILFALLLLLLPFPSVSIPPPLTLHSRLLNATPHTDRTKDWLEIGRYSVTRDPLVSGGLMLEADTSSGDMWKDHRTKMLQHMRSLPSSSSALLSLKLTSSDIISSSSPWHLQTSVPLAHLSPTSSSHGVLSLHLTTDGSPFALTYERHPTEGSTYLLTDDEFVLQHPASAPDVLVMPKQPAPSADAPKPPPTPLSLIQRYWWVLVVVLLVTAMMGTEPPQAAAGQPQQTRGR
eukprot:GHVS01068012.1.p1 GENE.GHVS01068012.1~~GHVS01068012.1.p1  ORF type:complete len:239 (+),score=46.18 GHVS01068012.1:157-873(+)